MVLVAGLLILLALSSASWAHSPADLPSSTRPADADTATAAPPAGSVADTPSSTPPAGSAADTPSSTPPEKSADTPREPRDRVDYHVRHANELVDHFDELMRNGCPRFGTPAEWDAWVDQEVDRLILLMAHLEQAWKEAKTTPDDDVRRTAKAPRRRAREARPLLEKLDACARDHGSALEPLPMWARIQREVPRRQAQIALP
jgi:hypothetical protein